MAKSIKYTIIINSSLRFTGRLIGFIDDEECRAIMNVKDAARKVSTAEGVDIMDYINRVLTDKRFVVVTDDLTDGVKEIFLSPKIQYITISRGKRGYHCRDDNDYYLEEIA